MQNFRLLTPQVKFHQICTLKVCKVSAKKSVGESCLMIPKSDSVHPPPFYRGVEPPTKFLKKMGGLTEPQILEGDCWERRG